MVGIIKAILDSAGFPTKKIEYYTNEEEDDKGNTTNLYPSTLFFIVFEPQAINRI